MRRALSTTGARIRGERSVRRSARLGYVARGVFYAVLAYLVCRVAALRGAPAQHAQQRAQQGSGAQGTGGHQANAGGALSLLAHTTMGMAALALAAAGFLLLGVVRLRAAWSDSRSPRLRRLSVAGQGGLYLVLGTVPISFLTGHRATGSEGQQHRTTRELLGWPGGPALVVAVGVGVLAVCAWQIRGVLRQDFTDGLDLTRAPRVVQRTARAAGSVGIAGRALLFVPIGIFFIAAGISYDPRDARGLDAELLLLAAGAWGDAVLGVVALALLIFAYYSLLEARYRDVTRGV